MFGSSEKGQGIFEGVSWLHPGSSSNMLLYTIRTSTGASTCTVTRMTGIQ